jgi:hypothetical protein
MKITINHNGFHGCTICTLNLAGKPGERIELTCSQIKKLSRAACGMSDCKCGESLLAACEELGPWEDAPREFIRIPASGNEINVRGNYPQN